MNENIDLTKILEGLEGINVWTSIWGTCTFTKIDGTDIEVELQNRCHRFIEKNGRHPECVDGECIIFPSKEQRDWSKFVRPIKNDSIMMCSEYKNDIHIQHYEIKYYYGVVNGKHYCYTHGNSKDFNAIYYHPYPSIIPFDKFNPNDIEGSIKYNIQK